jgi:cytochrome P450
MGQARVGSPVAGADATFDHRTDAAMRADQFPEWDRLRGACPTFVNTVTAPRPVWYVTRYEDVREAFGRPETFSSRSVESFESAEMAAAKQPWIPVEIDPPLHSVYRAVVADYFTPRSVAALEPRVRALAGELVDTLRERDGCEFIADFGKLFSTTIFMEIMGLPVEDAPQLLGWIATLMHTRPEDDPDYMIRRGVRAEVFNYLGALFARRREEPREDMVTHMAQVEITDPDGVTRRLTDQELMSFGFQLYMAGLDTVAGALGYTFRYLAEHPDVRRSLSDGSASGRDVAEELLRTHSIVNTGRVVTEDTAFAGCPMKAGDRVVLATAAANRDPAEFGEAAEVVIGRRPNRHIAFGAGPHRCLGSHLARLELGVALEEWHRRIPEYRIPAGAELVDRVGSVSGLTALPLEWD